MTHNIETQWMGKMQFNALVSGHTLIMDTVERIGGEDLGPNPKPFILTALSGCTGMDIASLLRKAGKEMKKFNIRVSGELSKRAPVEYTSIHMVYEFNGDEEHREAALQAVTDSQMQYCGVSRMLKKIMPVTWEVHYNGVQVFNNQPEMAINEN